MKDVTKILSEIKEGLPNASDELLPIVYEELRRLAASKMNRESPEMTLQATALVHEAYLRLVGSPEQVAWDNRGHFFAAAGEAMRRILVEAARRRSRQKRGGGLVQHVLDESRIASPAKSAEMLAVHEALDRLESVSPEAAELVKLRYFAGFTVYESAEMLGFSPRKANQIWAYARAWLLEELDNAAE